jgi:signal transduction histidine kinase/ActR/RegA family two-component response regulator
MINKRTIIFLRRIVTDLTTYRSKTLVTAGFITMLFLLTAFVGLWVNNLVNNKSIVQQLNDEQSSARSILTLHYMLNEQQELLDRISSASSLEEKQRYFEKFQQLIQFMDTVVFPGKAMHPQFDVAQARQRIRDFIAGQLKIIEQVTVPAEDAKAQLAFAQFVRQSAPMIQNLNAYVDEAVNYEALVSTKNDIADILEKSEQNYRSSYYLIAFLGTFGLAFGIFTIYVVRSTGATEDALLEQGERIRALHEIISRPDLTFDEQIDETLRLGCRLLGTEIGKVGRQDPANNASEFLNTIVMSDLPAKRGIVLPLDKTFCQVTFSSPQTIAISHVSESEYKDHPAAGFLGMESYIGCSIDVHGKKFGTVNFSNRKPVKKPFTETDKDLVNLMGSWISVMMERQLEAEELKKSKDAADAANQAKSAFLANMSHEIRTPLTAILGYSDMLLDSDQSRDELEHEVDSIIRSGAHLQRIINDILDLSKIEAGQLVIEKLDVQPARLMHDAESIFGARAREKGLDFKVEYEFPVPKTIHTDPTRLKQIVFNLCGNALKFTEEGGITVKMGYLQDKKQLLFQVIDTGIGMSEQELTRLFKPFSQADSSTTRKYGGTGLGLCISQQLAQKLGGDVWVESEKGKGTTFSFSVSVGDVESSTLVEASEDMQVEAIEETVRIVPNTVSGHVLVVEDSPDNQDLLCKYLIKAGATVEVVDNGLMAVQKALTCSYDLILMDVQMPIMDGLTATKKLRSEGYTRPIVNVTANALKEDREKCLKAGADNYLTKPVDVSEFYKVLQTYLKRHNTDNKGVNVA